MQRALGEVLHPDRNHLHHRLLDLASPSPVVLSFLLFLGAMGMLAFILSVLPQRTPSSSSCSRQCYRFGVVVLRFIEGRRAVPDRRRRQFSWRTNFATKQHLYRRLHALRAHRVKSG